MMTERQSKVDKIRIFAYGRQANSAAENDIRYTHFVILIAINFLLNIYNICTIEFVLDCLQDWNGKLVITYYVD